MPCLADAIPDTSPLVDIDGRCGSKLTDSSALQARQKSR